MAQQTDRLTQQKRLLDLLRSREWVGLPEILDLRIASYTRRLSDLRDEGHIIECETSWVKGVKHSRYRLVRQPKQMSLIA
jgi:hypothetical protein